MARGAATRLERRVLGLLQLSDRESGDYTAEDEAALVLFTDLLALTLESLWRLRDAQKRAL